MTSVSAMNLMSEFWAATGLPERHKHTVANRNENGFRIMDASVVLIDPAGWLLSAMLISQIALSMRLKSLRVGVRTAPESRLLATGELWKSSNLCRSEEHTYELQSRQYLVCRLLLEKK